MKNDRWNREVPFISHLERKRDDRAMLAALRRGLGQPPGAVPAMFPYVVPWVEQRPQGSWYEEAHYIIAALFGYSPESTRRGNMGTHFATVQRRFPATSDAVERRFITLMAAHPEDLGFHLRQAVSLLKAREVPINWHELMYHVIRWDHPDRRAWIHRQWANEFWGTPESTSPDDTHE